MRPVRLGVPCRHRASAHGDLDRGVLLGRKAEGGRMIEPEDLQEITLDTRISDYCREEDTTCRNARALSRWARDLERVGARVGHVECGENGSEVNFEMTLRQA